MTIRADLDEVRAAVSNLIDNAVKYSGSERQRDRGDCDRWTESTSRCA